MTLLDRLFLLLTCTFFIGANINKRDAWLTFTLTRAIALAV